MQKYFPYHLEAMSSYASLNQRISDLICKILVLGISIWLACMSYSYCDIQIR